MDLFSGIGGITKALDGYVVPVAYCEIEPYARGVLLSRMHAGDLPLAPIWDDILTLRGAMLPQVDIIYGGFPCQDISTAGHGKGLAGQRSGLFFEIMRLAEEIKPKFIFLENVANIRCKGLNTVVGEMDRLGYDCRWGILSASDVGAPHKRDRWFLLAHSNRDRSDPRRPKREGQRRGLTLIGTGSSLANPDSGGCTKPAVVRQFPRGSEIKCTSEDIPKQPSSNREKGNAFGENASCQWWAVEPNVGRVAHGVLKRVDRLRALGNAVVPQQAREAFERLMGLKG